MSLSADILTLNSALSAFTYGQNVTAENIANVNTPGYTTQLLNLESLQDFGGVAVAGVGSARNTFLYSQIDGQLALQGFTTAQLSIMNQIASILPEVGNASATGGINGAINNLSAAWNALAAAPASAADQTTVVNDMATLANLFETDSSQLYNLQQNLNTQISQAVTQVNSLESQILTLNQQIVALGGNQSAQTSTLIDQRQVDAQQLVTLTGGSVNYATDGAMVVTFSGGTLVDGVNTYNLGTMNSPTVPGLLDIGYQYVPNSNAAMADVTSDFTSGTLGGLYSGQASVQQSVLTLNKMAAGIIAFTNEVNESAVGPNGNTNALFYGTEASDIFVNPDVLTNPSYVLAGNTLANPGNLATVQGAMTTLNMYSEIETFNTTPLSGGIELNQGVPINADLSLASQAGSWSNPTPSAGGGTMVINAGDNSVTLNWTSTETLNQIIAAINAQGGGAIYATLQTIPNGATADGQPLNPGQYVHIYANAPMSIYDQSGNLANALQLTAVLASSAPINAVPTNSVNQVNPGANLNSVGNELSLFTQPVAPQTGGVVVVNGDLANAFTWIPGSPLNTILGQIQTAAPNAPLLYALFNQQPLTATESVTIYSQVNGAITLANPLQSVSIGDVTGNLTQVLNLNTDTNATELMAGLTTTVRNSTTASQAELTQATNLVNATQALQTEQSGVDVNAQLAQAMLYENAYDAAVRMQYVLENMLNYLITEMGSPNSGSGPIGS